MSLDTRFDTKTGVLWIVLDGEIDFKEVMTTVEDLYSTAAYDRRIWDIRKTTTHLSPEGVAALGRKLLELSEGRTVRSALLTTTPRQFGVSRMLQPRVDPGTISLGVFKEEDQALAWVTADHPPADPAGA